MDLKTLTEADLAKFHFFLTGKIDKLVKFLIVEGSNCLEDGMHCDCLHNFNLATDTIKMVHSVRDAICRLGIPEPPANTAPLFLSFDDMHNKFLHSVYTVIAQHKDIVPVNELEDERLFYYGGFTREGKAIFFCLLHRLPLVLPNPLSMLANFFRVGAKSLEKPYSLVLDMTRIKNMTTNQLMMMNYVNMFLKQIPFSYVELAQKCLNFIVSWQIFMKSYL